MVNTDIHNVHCYPKLTSQHGDRRAAAQEVVHHLRRHFAGIRTNAFFTDAMISATDEQDLNTVQTGKWMG